MGIGEAAKGRWRGGDAGPSALRRYGVPAAAGAAALAAGFAAMCSATPLGCAEAAGAWLCVQSAAESAAYFQMAASKRGALLASGRGLARNLQEALASFATLSLRLAAPLAKGGGLAVAKGRADEWVRDLKYRAQMGKLNVGGSLELNEFGSWAKASGRTKCCDLAGACEAWLARPFNPAWKVPSGLEPDPEKPGALRVKPAELGENPNEVASMLSFEKTVEGLLAARAPWLSEEELAVARQAMAAMAAIKERSEIAGAVGEACLAQALEALKARRRL